VSRYQKGKTNLDFTEARDSEWQHERTHAHTHTFNGPFSGTTQVSRYQKGKTNLDFTEARDSEWQQLGYVQVCTSLQTDNHASTPPFTVYNTEIINLSAIRGSELISYVVKQ